MRLSSADAKLTGETAYDYAGISVSAAGDVNNDLPLLHEASDEGRIAGENAGRYPQVQPGLRRSPLSGIFSDPQIAVVGKSWTELQSRPVVTGRVSFENLDIP